MVEAKRQTIQKVRSQLSDELKPLLKKLEELTGPLDTNPKPYKAYSQKRADYLKSKEESLTEDYQLKQENIRKFNNEIDIIRKKISKLNEISLEITTHPPGPGNPGNRDYEGWLWKNLYHIDDMSKYRTQTKRINLAALPSQPYKTPAERQAVEESRRTIDGRAVAKANLEQSRAAAPARREAAKANADKIAAEGCRIDYSEGGKKKRKYKKTNKRKSLRCKYRKNKSRKYTQKRK